MSLNVLSSSVTETYVCPVTHFKCNNHFCIPGDNVCNFVDDCGDGSDENKCCKWLLFIALIVIFPICPRVCTSYSSWLTCSPKYSEYQANSERLNDKFLYYKLVIYHRCPSRILHSLPSSNNLIIMATKPRYRLDISRNYKFVSYCIQKYGLNKSSWCFEALSPHQISESFVTCHSCLPELKNFVR